MKFNLKHNYADYIKGQILLWVLRLYKRVILQRRPLSIILLLVFFLLFIFNIEIAFVFSIFIIIIILIDLMVVISDSLGEKRRVRQYILSGGENIEIVADKYFAFLQDDKEFQKTEWSDVSEICRLDNPKIFSFKNKKTKRKITIYKSELQGGYDELLGIVISNASVIPLI